MNLEAAPNTRNGFATAVAQLVLAVTVGFALLGAIGFQSAGWPGLEAAAVAAGVCLLGGVTALAASSAIRGPEAVLYSVVFGMFFRMGFPLFVGGYLHWKGGSLAQAGVLFYILVFYLLTLAVDTILIVKQIRIARSYVISARPIGPPP